MKFKGSALKKIIVAVLKLLTFLAVLYTVLLNTAKLYKKNIPEILDGTWEYDKLEAAFMGAPLVMVFLFLLYIIVKVYEQVMSKKSNKIA